MITTSGRTPTPVRGAGPRRSARRLRGVLLDRLVSADPGLIRLYAALRVVLSVVIALPVLVISGLAAPAVLLGCVVAMMSPFMAAEPKPAARALTMVLLPVPAAVSITLAALLGRYPIAADAAFVVVIFVAVYLRRFGPRGFGLGMLGFMPFFFALFVHATAALLPKLLLGVLIGVACAALTVFVLLPHRSGRALRRMITALRARMARVVGGVADLVDGGELNERTRQAMVRAETRLHDCALLIEAELDVVLPADQAQALRRLVIGIELTTERLAVTARRVAADELGPHDRVALHAELVELLGLVRRDPRNLPAGEDAVARAFVRREDTPGPLAAARLRKAMSELAVAVASARVLAESLAAPESSAPDLTGQSPVDTEYQRFADQPVLDEPVPAEPTGWRRPTTRQAVQVSVAAVLAIVAGELLSPQRWYWAVITAFVVFAGTSSRGDILVKGMRRIVGTLLGVVCGVLVAVAVSGQLPLMIAVILLCVFCAFYFIQVSYGLMTFFITLMLGVLYDLLGTFTPAVMLLRLEETALGAAAGGLAAVLVLPTSTIGSLRTGLADLLRTLQGFVTDTVALLADGESADLVDGARQVDRALATVRATAQPLTHVISPLRTRREDVRYALTLLSGCAFYARLLATHAEPAHLCGDDRIPLTGRRITENLGTLADAVLDPSAGRPLAAGDLLSVADPTPPGERPTVPKDLRRRRLVDAIDRLDDLVLALARPLDLPETPAIDPGK